MGGVGVQGMPMGESEQRSARVWRPLCAAGPMRRQHASGVPAHILPSAPHTGLHSMGHMHLAESEQSTLQLARPLQA